MGDWKLLGARARWVLLVVPLALVGGCSQQSDISFFVLVKSSNYAQDPNGDLTLLNYHFFSEIFLRPGSSLVSASLARAESPSEPWDYSSRGDNYYFEGGHFDSQEEVDSVHPNGTYAFSIATPTVEINDLTLKLEGPGGATDIPEPITVSLWQDERRVDPLSVDPAADLVIRWSDYSNGMSDPRGIVDDMIFLVVADCHGERLFHTGLPFQGEFTTYRTTEMVIEAGLLGPGQPYSAFVEFPHVVDSRVEGGVPGFTSYATATYLDIRTAGPSSDQECPEAPPPMDTGQTDRMEATGVGGSNGRPH